MGTTSNTFVSSPSFQKVTIILIKHGEISLQKKFIASFEFQEILLKFPISERDKVNKRRVKSSSRHGIMIHRHSCKSESTEQKAHPLVPNVGHIRMK